MAYEYDEYGRLRGNGEPAFHESRETIPEHYPNEYYSSDSRDNNNSRRPDDRQRASPLKQNRAQKMSTTSDSDGSEHVSAETIAAITERIKQEVLDHLKQTGSMDGQPRSESMNRRASTRSASTSSRRSISPPSNRRVYTPPSPIQTSKSAYPPPPSMGSRRSPPVSPVDKQPGVRFTNRDPKPRPGGTRTFSQLELSTIDLKWGQLFENDGTPTLRLGQFLRGLANHIVDDYLPKKSIVVTPAKLTEFYSKFPIEKELKGLTSIFRSQNNECISKFFQALGCQHFLIQDDARNAPSIPALTPLGFAHFMTVMILAYPEEEAKRLEKVVLDCPIDADGQTVDGKPERLPKAISRHLLPEVEDRASRRLIDRAIEDFALNFDKKASPSFKGPSLSRNSSTSQNRRPPVEIHQAAPQSRPIERERAPYAGAPSDNSTLNEDSVKIERERQPYSAQPGAGKVYDDSQSRSSRRESSGRRESRERRESGNRGDRRESSENGRRDSSMRRDSTMRRTSRESSSRAQEVPIKEPTQHHRTQSNASSNFIPPAPRARRRRDSSPPIKNFARHSEPANIDTRYGASPASSFTSYPGPGLATQTQFPPPPPQSQPPIDIRTRNQRGSHDYSLGGKGSDEDNKFATGEFNSPREAERWDRYQDRGGEGVDPLDSRGSGAPAEDWYREPPRGTGYYASRGY